MTDLAAIRERTEADWTTDPENIVPGLAQDLMQARVDRKFLLAELDRLSDYQNEPEGTTDV